MDETIRINIRSNDDPKTVYISVTCIDYEREQLIALFEEFKDIFAWSYADLKGLTLTLSNMPFPSRRISLMFDNENGL